MIPPNIEDLLSYGGMFNPYRGARLQDCRLDLKRRMLQEAEQNDASDAGLKLFRKIRFLSITRI